MCMRLMARYTYIGMLCLLSIFTTTKSVVAQTPQPPDLSPVAVPIPNSVAVQKRIEPSGELSAGEEATAYITVSGQNLAGCFGTPATPIDAVFVMDTSPSAGRPGPGSNFERTQRLMLALWAQMDQGIYLSTLDRSSVNSRLALVTVDTGTITAEVNVRMPFTDDLQTITTTIASLANGADSSFDRGIAQALQLLKSSARRDVGHVMVIFLHDSFFALQDGVKQAAQQAISDGIKVFVVANTLNIPTGEQLTQETGTALVATSRDVLVDPSTSQLRGLFVTSTGSDSTISARQFRIYEEFSPPGIVDIIGIDNGGRLDGNRIVWTIDSVSTGSPVELTYRFRVRETTLRSIRTVTGASCLDCNGFLHTYLDEAGRPVGKPVIDRQTDISADQTPPGPTPEVVTGEPSSVPVTTSLPGPGLIDVPTGGTFLGTGLPAWLLALPIILIVLWLLWRWWQGRSKGPTQAVPAPPTHVPPNQNKGFEGRRQTESGEDIAPGRAPDDTFLYNELLAAPSVVGTIPTNSRGFARSRPSVQVFSSARELVSGAGLNLEAMGTRFVWDREGGPMPVSTALLQRAIQNRVASDRPVLAVWTQEPVDNIEFEVRIKPGVSANQIEVQAKSTYRPPRPGESAPQKVYRLDLRFLNDDKEIVVLPAIEVEAY